MQRDKSLLTSTATTVTTATASTIAAAAVATSAAAAVANHLLELGINVLLGLGEHVDEITRLLGIYSFIAVRILFGNRCELKRDLRTYCQW